MDLVITMTIKPLCQKMTATPLIEQSTRHHLNTAPRCHQVVDIFHGAESKWITKGFAVFVVLAHPIKLHQVVSKACWHIRLS
ncbi:hypothetical protein D3C87_703010 [compost metagenome]